MPDCDPVSVLENHTLNGNTGCTPRSSQHINSIRPVNLGLGGELIRWENQICQEEIQDYYAVNSNYESMYCTWQDTEMDAANNKLGGRCFSTDGIGPIEAFSVTGCQ